MSQYPGLTSKKADKNIKKFGLNLITEGKKKTILILFFEQFQNFLVILLLFAAIFSLALGEILEGSLILGIVLLNALFGVYQERKAEQAIAALTQMTATMVRVIRDGKETIVDNKYIVPDDIIKIEQGNKIPADAIILSSLHLEVDESALTGESYPVEKKHNDDIAAGTIVTKGRATARVIKTGMETEFGKIASHLSKVKQTKTPLQKKLSRLSKVLGAVGIISSMLVFLLSYFVAGDGMFPSILLAISLAVAVVPEGLPAIMTVTLAIGVKNMAKRKAIMRNLASIEALGNITLIATDKTGTLTTNVMRVKELWLNNSIFKDDELKAIYKPRTKHFHEIHELLMDGIVCSTASLSFDKKKHKQIVIGDPTEGALLYLAEDCGIEIEKTREKYKLLEEIPFDSTTKRMLVTVSHKGKKTTYAKGAPESILDICSSLDPGIKKEITRTFQTWAKKGLRVLAFSRKEEKEIDKLSGKRDNSDKKRFKDHVFLGMVAIHDAPRPEAKESVERARMAGIRSVMITGDNEKTAQAVGEYVGIYQDGDTILTGKQLDTLDDKKLKKMLLNVSIFARTTPFHKSRLVELYQELGEIVASTGDGVNDAIALKQADVGVAMGLVGTDVTREAADMVITDDNFRTIVNAVEEGRNIIRNIRNVMQYLLSTNAIEVAVLIGGLILGVPHVLNALMLLFINLITDSVPALMLAFAPRDPSVMKKPSSKHMVILRKIDYQYIISVTGIGFFIFFLAYYHPFTHNIYQHRMFVFCTLVVMQAYTFVDVWISHKFLFHSRKMLRSWYFVAGFMFVMALQYVVATVPLFARIFHVQAISPGLFGLSLLYAFCLLVFLEVLKVMRRIVGNNDHCFLQEGRTGGTGFKHVRT